VQKNGAGQRARFSQTDHVLESAERRGCFLSAQDVCPINADDTVGNDVVK
jgi:hypothetical protein